MFLVLVSGQEVLNETYHLLNAEIKGSKSVWTLSSGLHPPYAGVGPFLVTRPATAHCCSQADADQSTPCTVNSLLKWRMGLLWLAAKHSMVNLSEPTVILTLIQEIKDKLKQVPS